MGKLFRRVPGALIRAILVGVIFFIFARIFLISFTSDEAGQLAILMSFLVFVGYTAFNPEWSVPAGS